MPASSLAGHQHPQEDRVHRDSAVTPDLAESSDELAEMDSEFRAARADTRERLGWFRSFADARRAKRLSQADVAAKMGTTQSSVSEWEKGIVEPRLSTLQRYARILGYRLVISVVEESIGPYQDRRVHYQFPLSTALRGPAGRNRDNVRGDAIHPEVTPREAVRLGNVYYPNFQRKESSPFGESLVERFTRTTRMQSGSL